MAAPALVGEGDGLLGGALDDRNELDVLRLQLVAKEAVHLERVVGVGGVDGAQDVDVDIVPAQAVPAADHVVEAAPALLVDAVGVVHGARAVDAEADQVVVLLEERGPLVIDQRAVGLDGVQDAAVLRLAVLLGQLDRALVEVQPAQHRLAALPGDLHLRAGRRRHQLRDVGLERRLVHQRALALAVEVFLGQEEAVLAAQVAGRAGGLGEQMVGRLIGRKCLGCCHVIVP